MSSSKAIETAVLAWANAREPAQLRELVETHWNVLNTSAADQLLGELLQQYSGQEATIAQLRSRRHLLHRCRTEGIHAAFASESPQFDPDIFETVRQFLIAGSDELQRIFRASQDVLVSDEAQRVLQHLERYYQDDPNLERRARERRGLIRVAIDRGVDNAFPIFSNKEALEVALSDLMEAIDWPSKIEIIRSQAAVLLSDEADRFIEALLSVNPDPLNRMYQELAFYRGILARARRDGVDSICFDGGFPRSNADEPPSAAERAQMDELLALITGRQGAYTMIRMEDIQDLLRERPDLVKAWEHIRPWTLFVGSDDADRVELKKLVEELTDPSRPGGVERTVRLLRRAVEIPLAQQSAPLRAAFHADLARALLGCPGLDRAALLEEALSHATVAESVWTKEMHPAEWAENRWSMGNILTHRMVGGREKNIERALECFQTAREILDAEDSSPSRVTRYISLGNAYSMRVVGGMRENIEEALKYLQLALKDPAFQLLHLREQGDAWAIFGNAMGQRVAGERVDNIEEAIYALRQAQQCFLDADVSERLGLAHYALATALMMRQYGDPAENRQEALKLLDACVQLCTREQWPERWAMALMARASLIQEQAHTREEIDGVLDDYRAAQTYFTRATSPHDWAAIEQVRGSALLDWAQTSGQLEGVEDAIRHLRSALEIFHREGNGLRWSAVHFKLGRLYSLLAKRGVADATIRAQEHYRLSLEERPADSCPAEHSESQAALALLLLAAGRWEDAHSALSASIEAGVLAFETAYTEPGRHAAIARVSQLFAEDAYSLVCLRRYAEALVCLDGGKARILTQSLALSEVDPAGLDLTEHSELMEVRKLVQELEMKMRGADFAPLQPVDRHLALALKDARTRLADLSHRMRVKRPEFMATTLSLPALLALAPPGGALVAPVVATHGTAVFVIPYGIAEVTDQHILRVDTFTRADLIALLQGAGEGGVLGGWLHAYNEQTEHWEEWLETIVRVGHELWKSFMEAVHSGLETLGVGQGAPIVLMPQGGLALLPLHAAWRDVEGCRRYVADDYALSYAPGGYALEVSRQRVERVAKTRSMLAVINPTGDLKYAQAEGDALEVMLGTDCRTLHRSAATLDAVRKAAPNHTYVHFCCHGSCDWYDPMKSGLQLAGGERLTLSDVLGTLDLTHARLVTLSACETGITDIRRMPDEFIGLPTGLLHAGAAAVVSTLWLVDDLSTMLLMERFYLHHISEGEELAAALRKAQLWVKSATNEELAQNLRSFRQADPEGPYRSHRMAWERFANLARTEHARRPFEHPYYWAAFVLNGM